MAIKFTPAQQARIDAANQRKAELLSRDMQQGPLMPLIQPATQAAQATTTPLLAKKDQGAMPDTTTYVPQDLSAPPTVLPTTGLEVPTARKVEALGMERGTGDAETIKALAQLGGFKTKIGSEGEDFVVGDTREGKEATQAAIEAQASSDEMRASRLTQQMLEAQMPEDFIQEFESTVLDADDRPIKMESTYEVVSSVIARGDKLANSLLERSRPTLSSDPNIDPVAGKVQAFLGNQKDLNGNPLLFENGRFTPAVGTATAISFLKLARDIRNKTDDAVEATVTGLDTDSFEPDMIKGRIVKDVLNSLIPNPYEGAEANRRTDYGGAGDLIDPDIIAALEPLFYESVVEQGFFSVRDLNENDPTTTLKEEQLVLSPEGHEFLNQNMTLLNDLHPDERVDISYLPTLGGEGYNTRERELGDKAKPISRRTKADRNTSFEDSVKMKLGFMPMRVDKDGLSYASMMLSSTLEPKQMGVGGAQESRPGVTYKGVRFVFTNSANNGFFYSEGEYARTLGLDFSKWLEAKENALKKYGRDREAKANDQADKVMRMRARTVMRTLEDATLNSDKVFYNKWMHASSVGRYFVRNQVLNPQTDKLARSLVLSAERLLVDLNNPLKGKDGKRLNNWKYIIGKNLLDPEGDYNLTRGLRTEDMQWNAISRLADQIISNEDDPTYQRWLLQGQKLREAVRTGNKELLSSTLQAATHGKSLKKNGEWGYKLQSYIDFANYHDAKQKANSNKKNNINQPVYFEMKATTQHDGKQNGIAIQAMQTGKTDTLKLVGMMFNADKDSVIPQGDIRDRFLNKAIGNTQTVFASKPEVRKFWDEVLSQIDDTKGPERAELIKALSKTPLMESSYGKPIDFHQETAIDFINSEDGQRLIKNAVARVSDVTLEKDYFDQKIYSDLNSLIGAALTETLDIKRQQMFKKAGQLWSMLGTDVKMKGPLGTNIYMGTNEHFKTGQTVAVPTVEGEVRLVDITRAEYTPSSGKRKTTKIYNYEKQMYETSPRSKFGQLVSNQLPVLTVQQIDAAIMARTIDSVNRSFDKGFGKAGFERPKFMIPVHDAIITNADAVDVYHREINNQFRLVNQQYSISKAVYQGLTDSMAQFNRMVEKNPNRMVDLSYESKYRAVHDYLVRIEDKMIQRAGTIETAEGTKAAKVAQSAFDESILRTVKAGGRWSRDGGEISLSTLKQIIDKISGRMNVVAELKVRHEDIETLKPRVWKMLSALGYQYN